MLSPIPRRTCEAWTTAAKAWDSQRCRLRVHMLSPYWSRFRLSRAGIGESMPPTLSVGCRHWLFALCGQPSSC